MYWYPLSQVEEDRAWKQASAQAKDTGDEDGKPMKFIGNLGEIVVNAFFEQVITPESTELRKVRWVNQDAMENGNPEDYCEFDFRVGRTGYKVDVKTSSDIRKFDPVHTYHDPEAPPRAPMESKSGYPTVDVKNVDAFIFVLVSNPHRPTPAEEQLPSETELEEYDGEVPTAIKRMAEERSGSYVATILGWLYSQEATGEMTGNMNLGGKFTRLALRDMYELLIRADAL